MKWREGRGSDEVNAPGEAHFEVEFDYADEAAGERPEGAEFADSGEAGETGGVRTAAAVAADPDSGPDEVWSRELPGWLRLTWRRAAVLGAAAALVAGSVVAVGQVRAVQQRDRNRYTVVVVSGRYVPGTAFPALDYDLTLMDQGPAPIIVLTLEVFAPGLFDAYAWKISGLPVGRPTEVMLQGFYVCVGQDTRSADSVIMSVTGPTGQPDSLTLDSTLTGGPSPSWVDQRTQLCSGAPGREHLKVQEGRSVGSSGVGGEHTDGLGGAGE
ncbi:MAG TPA: hypothetical protein VGM10_16075 [Actinocrinis sp.]